MRLVEENTGEIYQIPNWLAENNGIDRREMFIEAETDKTFIFNFGFDELLGTSKKVSVAKSQCRISKPDTTMEDFT